MSGALLRTRRRPSLSTWAETAELHVHCMSPWWTQIHARSGRTRIRHVGNVSFLPPPVAGYRIRHHADGSTVEIKPSRAVAIALGQCATAGEARSLLAVIARVHARPFLGEIGEVVA